MKDHEVAERSRIDIVEVSSITPHSKALLESGKRIVIDSVDVSRDFCKYMISSSLGAIPIYLGLLALFLPNNPVLRPAQGIVILIPVVFFLIASVVFTVAYLPQISTFSLDILDEIEKERARIVRRRSKLTWIGFSVFLIGVFTAVVATVVQLSI
jgi:hypothetical protein